LWALWSNRKSSNQPEYVPIEIADYYAELDLAYFNEGKHFELTADEKLEKNRAFKYETYIDECTDAYCDANPEAFDETVDIQISNPHGPMTPIECS
jgi:hypothetical protein